MAEKRTMQETVDYFKRLAFEYEKTANEAGKAHCNFAMIEAKAKAEAYELAAFEIERNMEDGVAVGKGDARDGCAGKLEDCCEFRICDVCGKPMVDGMTNEGNGLGADFHCHEECFEKAMDERYPDGWRKSPTGGEGEYGGYYEELLEDGTWEDTGIFYTQWR